MNALASGGQFTRQTLAKNMKLHSYSIQGNCVVKGDLYTRGELVATMPEVDALKLRLDFLEIAAGFPNTLAGLGLGVPTLDPPDAAKMQQLADHVNGGIGETHALFVHSLVSMIQELQRCLEIAREPIFDTQFHGVYTDGTTTVQIHAAKVVVMQHSGAIAGLVTRFELVNATKEGYNIFKWVTPATATLNLETNETSKIDLTGPNGVTHRLTESSDTQLMLDIGAAERDQLDP